MDSLVFDVLPGELAICRLAISGGVPPWAMSAGDFWSVTRRADELSIMCPVEVVPADVVRDAPWRALSIRGPMNLEIVGVAASFTAPLAAAGIPVMPVATSDTDVVLVHAGDLAGAVTALRGAGFDVVTAPGGPVAAPHQSTAGDQPRLRCIALESDETTRS